MKIRKRVQLFTCRPESMVCSRSISTGTSCTLKQRTGSSRGVALPLAVETAVAWHAVLRLAATAQPRSQISVPLGAILVELVVPMQLASRLLIRSAALKPQHQFLGAPTSTPIALTLSRVTNFVLTCRVSDCLLVFAGLCRAWVEILTASPLLESSSLTCVIYFILWITFI